MDSTTRIFEENTNGRDFVVGDIHGEYQKLIDELHRIGFKPERDRLFCVGDTIDRGPKSLDVLRLLDTDWFFSVLGNHEQMMIDSLAFASVSNVRNWTHNGGSWYFNLPQEEQDEAKALVDEHFTIQSPLYFEIPYKGKTYGICHAGFPEYEWADRGCPGLDTYEVVWSRRTFNRGIRTNVVGLDLIYHGHTPIKRPVSFGNRCYIDTGACYGCPITVLELGTKPEQYPEGDATDAN